MRVAFGVPIIFPILLMIVSLGQSTLMHKGQYSNRQYDDHRSTDSLSCGAELPIMNLVDALLHRISAPNGNSSVVIHIDNLYCVTGSQDVQINPCKQQVMNVARGDQVVNIENPRELSKRSLPRKCTSNSKHMTNEPHGTCATDSIDEDSASQGYNLQVEKHHSKSDAPWIRPTTKPILEGYPHLQSVHTLEKPGSESERKSENRDLFHLDIPALNIYIDGKPITNSFNPDTPSSEELSSKLFKEEVRELLLDGKRTSVGKHLLCDRKEEPPCDHGMVTFRGGLELSYEEFSKIIEDVSERPDYVKLIVPGGVTGPLSGYFQKVDKSLHEHALVHGVCLLDNGLLVPLRAMLRILKLHAWLCEMVPDFANEDVSKLHSSIKWTQTDGIVDLLRCFVKSNKIHVVLPGTSKVPFAQFEQEEEHIPKELQKRAKVEMLGFHIPYIIFRDKLVALCKEKPA